MSMITEQVEDLRELAKSYDGYIYPSCGKTCKALREAADTIEQLAAKVREDNAYQKAFEDIRAEIIMYKADCDLSISENDDNCRRCGDNVFGSILRIIDKHDPLKADPTYYHDTEHDADIEWGEEIDALVSGDIECGEDKAGMTKDEELEFLKMDLENIIQGMTICESILSQGEREHLDLHRRCLSVLERINPVRDKAGKGQK